MVVTHSHLTFRPGQTNNAFYSGPSLHRSGSMHMHARPMSPQRQFSRLTHMQRKIEQLEREKLLLEHQILCSLFGSPDGLEDDCAECPDTEAAISSARAH